MPLLATLRTEAADLLRNTQTPNVGKDVASIKLLDVLLSILQGICLIGIRRHGNFEAEEGTASSIREALGQEWVVEVRIDRKQVHVGVPANRGFLHRRSLTYYRGANRYRRPPRRHIKF